MTDKSLHKIFGAFVFFASFIAYFLTVQSTTSFWDCGEFIASAHLLQVPHPPGTPFFLLLGRLFSLFPIDANIGLKINMISVISSAFTILFLYLSAVLLIKNYQKKKEKSLFDSTITYISAAIGALSLGFGDTFWFNAVEAEVYALALFFATFVFWLALAWNKNADKEGHERYLLLIAYSLGISLGVHLYAVLAIIPIVMIVMFKKYLTDDQVLASTGKLFVIHSLIMLAIAIIGWLMLRDSTPPSHEEFKKIDVQFLIAFGVGSAIFMGVTWKKIFQKGSFYYSILIGGIIMLVVYPGVIKYIPRIIYWLGNDDTNLSLALFMAIAGGLGYAIYWSHQNNKRTINLLSKALLLVLVGYSSYFVIIIRANHDTPINLNSPKTVSELVKYINREQYGVQPMFKRRWSSEGHQMHIYRNHNSDFSFWLHYQMGHMFNRYLLWNYVGRDSTVQDADWNFYKFWAIPLLIGLLGLLVHFKKDWKMASILLILYLFMGYLMAYYSNMQNPQPRERDYFAVGAFFVFSIWIALGVRGIADLLMAIKDKTASKIAVSFTLFALVVLIPANMLGENYHKNDRSKNFIPWDYAYNMLQSVEKDAIIFTNGDNDTFPLWYLQDVEGVRRDVRIANLSLINTSWYSKQLKNTRPYGAKKVKMSYTDRQLDQLTPRLWKPRIESIQLTPEAIKKFGITDTAIINKGKVEWLMENTQQQGKYKIVVPQDILVKDIIQSNKFERPVYFAVTCSDNSMIGLDDFLEMEGLALKVTPIKKKVSGYYRLNVSVLEKQLLDNPTEFSKEYSPGFKFRSLNDPEVFLDANHKRMTLNYRNAYLRLAAHYLFRKHNKQKGMNILEKMEENIPMARVDMPLFLKYYYSSLLNAAGAKEKYREITSKIESELIASIRKNPRNFTREGNPYQMLFDIYNNLKEYKKALDLSKALKKMIPNDKNLDNMIQNYTQKLNANKPEVKQ